MHINFPDPTVSVVIPTRDREKFVREAITSVRAQDHSDWECIVVDDGSSDQTQASVVALSKEDARIRYYGRPALGAAAARNFGIQMARGRYLCFLDSDDRYLPSALTTLVSAIESESRIQLVYAGYHVSDADGKWLRNCPPQPAPERPELYKSFIIPRHNPILPSASIVSRHALADIGTFNIEFVTSQTVELWGRFVEQYDIAHVDAYTTIYRRHGGQVTTQRALRRSFYDLLAVRALDRLQEEKLFPASTPHERAAAMEHLAKRLYRSEFPTLDACAKLLHRANELHSCPLRHRLLRLCRRYHEDILRARGFPESK